MPKYPAQIDNTQSLPTAVDNLTPVQGSIFNKLRDAVLAVESELGVKPSSSYTTVRSRLDTLESIVGNLQVIELHKDLGGTLEEPKVIGIQGRPVSSVTPSAGQVLAWNGIAWVPTTGAGGGGGFSPPAGSFPGQTLVWDGTDYIPDFILADVVVPPYDQTLTSTIDIVEVNQEVIDPDFTATYELAPTEASITDDVFSTPTDVTSTPTSFTSPHTYSKSAYGDVVTFTLTATQGYVNKSVDYQIAWGQKVYYGTFPNDGQTGESFVKSLIGQPVVNNKNVGFGINAGVDEKIYYACRSAYGDMIFTIHSIEGWFTKTDTFDITNDFGFTESYDLYESDDDNLGAVNIFVGDGMFQNGGGPIGPPGPTGPAGGAGIPLSTVRFVDISTVAVTQDGSIGSPFASIQDAVDDLTTGGTIYLIPGDYTVETLDFTGKEIKLIAMVSAPLTSAPYLPDITSDSLLTLTNIGQSTGNILNTGFVYLNNVRVDGNITAGALLANSFPDINSISLLGGTISCDGAVTINGYSVIGAVSSNDGLIFSNSTLNDSVSGTLIDAKNCTFNSSSINISGTAGKLVNCSFNNSTTITFTGAPGTLSVDQSTFELMFNAGVSIVNGIIHVLGIRNVQQSTGWDATGTVTHTVLDGGNHPAGVYLITSTIVITLEADTGTLDRTINWSTPTFGSDSNILGSITAVTTGTQLQNSLIVVSDGTSSVSVTYGSASITGAPSIDLYSSAIFQGGIV